MCALHPLERPSEVALFLEPDFQVQVLRAIPLDRLQYPAKLPCPGRRLPDPLRNEGIIGEIHRWHPLPAQIRRFQREMDVGTFASQMIRCGSHGPEFKASVRIRPCPSLQSPSVERAVAGPEIEPVPVSVVGMDDDPTRGGSSIGQENPAMDLKRYAGLVRRCNPADRRQRVRSAL